MKKLLGITLVFALLLLTGCGKKQVLHCKASKSGVDVIYNVTFNGIRISEMDLGYNMDLSTYSSAQIEALNTKDFCEVVKNAMSQYADAFKNCTQKIENKKLYVHTDLDVDKVAKNELQKFSSINDSKEGLEKVGYTCTIE